MWFEKGREKKIFFWLVSIVKNWSLGLLRAFSRPQLQFFVTWTSWLVSFTAINWSYHATSFHPSPKKKAWCEMRQNNSYEGDDPMTHILQNMKKKKVSETFLMTDGDRNLSPQISDSLLIFPSIACFFLS